MDYCLLGGADGSERGDDDIGGDVMPHEAKGFQCDFCTRMFKTIVDAVKHEDACKFNPARRSCYTCKHGELMTNKEFFEYSGDVGEHTHVCYLREYYGCKYFGKPIAENMDNIDCDTYDDGINPALPIRGTCLHWEMTGDEE